LKARSLAVIALPAALGLTFLVALVFLVVPSCSVDDVDYAGKTCETSCPEGLTCIDGTCQNLQSLVYATNFHVAWFTPNSIRWAWTLQGDGTSLVSYELIVTSPIPGAAGAKTWTSADNEELGGYQIKASSGFDLVTGTITSEMDPSTAYSAVLRLTDIAGHTFETESISAVTDVSRTRRLVVFDGALAKGNYLTPGGPGGIAVIGDGGLEGGPSLYYAVPPNATFVNLRIDDLRLTPGPTLTDKLFDSAYLELWIRGIGTPGSSWSEAWIKTFDADGGLCADFSTCIYQFPVEWVYHPDPVPPGRYRRVQIPLSQFSRLDDAGAAVDGEALSLDVLLAKAIDEVNVGCPYSGDDTATYLDQIAIWW
jgi:hypothetical protein